MIVKMISLSKYKLTNLLFVIGCLRKSKYTRLINADRILILRTRTRASMLAIASSVRNFC